MLGGRDLWPQHAHSRQQRQPTRLRPPTGNYMRFAVNRAPSSCSIRPVSSVYGVRNQMRTDATDRPTVHRTSTTKRPTTTSDDDDTIIKSMRRPRAPAQHRKTMRQAAAVGRDDGVADKKVGSTRC